MRLKKEIKEETPSRVCRFMLLVPLVLSGCSDFSKQSCLAGREYLRADLARCSSVLNRVKEVLQNTVSSVKMCGLDEGSENGRR